MHYFPDPLHCRYNERVMLQQFRFYDMVRRGYRKQYGQEKGTKVQE